MSRWRCRLAVSVMPIIFASVADAQTSGNPVTVPEPPIAPRVPHAVKSPNGSRADDYYWLRDDDPKTKRPEIIAHLTAENAYTDAMLAHVKPLQDKLV